MDVSAFLYGYFFSSIPSVLYYFYLLFLEIVSLDFKSLIIPGLRIFVLLGLGQLIGMICKKKGLSLWTMVGYEVIGIWAFSLIGFAWYLYNATRPGYVKEGSLGAFWFAIPEEFTYGVAFGSWTIMAIIFGIGSSIFFHKMTRDNKIVEKVHATESSGKGAGQL